MKKTTKRILCGVLAGAFSAMLLAGCGSGAKGGTDAKPTVIRVGSTLAATHPVNVALAQHFKPMVEEGSKGALKVEIYEGGTLGGEKELYDSVRNGNLQMCAVGTVMWNEVPKMAIPDFPFVFRDIPHARAVYNGQVGDEMAAELEKIGKVKFLGWFPNGSRVFSTNRTISKLEDFKGLRLRMPNNPIHIQVGTLLGANVTPMPLGEVFTALEQKVVDGQDNPLSTFRNEGWYEVQSDIFESNHMISTIELLGSTKMWSSLTKEQQTLIQQAGEKAGKEAWDLYVKSIEDDKKFLQERKLKITTPDEATRQRLVELMQPVYNDLYKKYDWAEETVKRIRATKS
ncbi:MAG: TRAP transporter substrate-binding protein [Sporomusaceae bacterium]|nr:TRAP transporter substrate-binding protein [Sporomusaceae bacterium]